MGGDGSVRHTRRTGAGAHLPEFFELFRRRFAGGAGRFARSGRTGLSAISKVRGLSVSTYGIQPAVGREARAGGGVDGATGRHHASGGAGDWFSAAIWLPFKADSALQSSCGGWFTTDWFFAIWSAAGDCGRPAMPDRNGGHQCRLAGSPGGGAASGRKETAPTGRHFAVARCFGRGGE